MTTTELNLNAWCAQRAVNYRNFEHHEMAMYPSSDDRDVALVEWTVRVLGNPLTAGSVEALRILAERHGLELNPAGTADQLTAANHRADGLAADVTSLQKAQTAYANEVDTLRMQVYAQKPVVEAALTWLEERETDPNVTPVADLLKAEDALHDAIEQYQVMDMALTAARDEQAEVAK